MIRSTLFSVAIFLIAMPALAQEKTTKPVKPEVDKNALESRIDDSVLVDRVDDLTRSVNKLIDNDIELAENDKRLEARIVKLEQAPALAFSDDEVAELKTVLKDTPTLKPNVGAVGTIQQTVDRINKELKRLERAQQKQLAATPDSRSTSDPCLGIRLGSSAGSWECNCGPNCPCRRSNVSQYLPNVGLPPVGPGEVITAIGPWRTVTQSSSPKVVQHQGYKEARIVPQAQKPKRQNGYEPADGAYPHVGYIGIGNKADHLVRDHGLSYSKPSTVKFNSGGVANFEPVNQMSRQRVSDVHDFLHYNEANISRGGEVKQQRKARRASDGWLGTFQKLRANNASRRANRLQSRCANGN